MFRFHEIKKSYDLRFGFKSITNKLFLGFVPVVIILVLVIIFSNQSNMFILRDYERSLKNYEILNEFFVNNSKMQLLLQRYVLTEYKAGYAEYQDAYLHSFQLINELIRNIDDQSSDDKLNDLKAMVATYGETVNTALNYYNQNNRIESYELFNEAEKLNKLISSTMDINYDIINEYSKKQRNLLLRREEKQAFYYDITITIIFFFSLAFVWLFSRGITKPIRKLVKNAEQISKGHFEVSPVNVVSRDEIFTLSKAFNSMVESIRFYINEMEAKATIQRKLVEEENENLRISSLLKQTQLNALQAQMNPHFLFNTLNIIGRTAYMEDANLTVKLLEATTDLLRYNLSKANKPVTLEEEIRCVKDYIYIQETRFGSRIRFNLEIEGNVENIMMPALIIQPLIENAIIHGVDNYISNAEINILVKKIDWNIIIKVIDNGVGMEESKIIELLNNNEDDFYYSNENEKGSIGVRSVKKRLELFYSNKDIMNIESRLNGGTVITLKLPINLSSKGEILSEKNSDS